MRSLVIYYSRTGRTKKIAEELHTSLGADIDEIQDEKKRSGIMGWLSAGRDARSKNTTSIKSVEKNPNDYQVVTIGTPTWNGTVSTPIRTYINRYMKSFRHVACFTTGDGEDPEALNEIEQLLEGMVIAKMHLVRTKEIETNKYHDKLEKFVEKIKSFTI
jgi:flavodoxin